MAPPLLNQPGTPAAARRTRRIERSGAGRRAFTLIELLVVVAIVAILAAILFPVFARARARAQETTCQSNLKQIGQAFTAYAADYDETYPADTSDPFLWQGRHWRWPLKSYLGYSGSIGVDANGQKTIMQADHAGPNILFCPADPNESFDQTSYAYSAAFYHTPDQVDQITAVADLYQSAAIGKYEVMPQTLGDVRFPGEKILAGEWASNHEPLPDPPDGGWWDWRGHRVYLFCDAHVKSLKATRIHAAVDQLPDPNVTVGGAGGKDID